MISSLTWPDPSSAGRLSVRDYKRPLGKVWYTRVHWAANFCHSFNHASTLINQTAAQYFESKITNNHHPGR